MKNLNLVYLSINVARCYEISKIGNHSLSIFASKDIPEEDIILFCKFYGIRQSKNADIVTEISYSADEIFRLFSGTSCETIEDINERIKSYPSVAVSINISGGIASILKSAIHKLNLSITQVNSIVSVSKTIALMDRKSIVSVEHIAEAIQYQSFDKN